MLKGRAKLGMLKGQVELSMLKGRAELGMLKGRVELDMLNSQCIVKSMWVNLYLSIVHQASNMSRRRRLFFTGTTYTSPQSTNSQCCQGLDVCSSQGGPVPVYNPPSVNDVKA
ncbi:hypothetical protein MTR_1g090970 [Medicago truncatula]|uniref:Uncharacterized protein n=1 Tax=Medicago truncatula TaxID=3880 RepID=A0A072VNM1_MEDTR|nr:hypothetical protein MTR_1g090970 [Medicago truncatula]